MKYLLPLALFCGTQCLGQTIPLYSGKIPNSKEVVDHEVAEKSNGIDIISKITTPTLSVFLADTAKATGTAVIIVPGGGYSVNAITHEGTDIARAFNEMGVTAFVLKYRIPSDASMTAKETGPLQDLQQAI